MGPNLRWDDIVVGERPVHCSCLPKQKSRVRGPGSSSGNRAGGWAGPKMAQSGDRTRRRP